MIRSHERTPGPIVGAVNADKPRSRALAFPKTLRGSPAAGIALPPCMRPAKAKRRPVGRVNDRPDTLAPLIGG